MEAYILNRQNMAAQYIAMRPILDLCKEMVWIPETWVARRWWEQEGMEFAVSRALVLAEEEEGGVEYIEGEAED